MEQCIYPVLLGSGTTARRAALRIYLRYGLRAVALSRTPSAMDHLFLLWHKQFFRAGMPDSLLLDALLQAAEGAREYDKIPVLYLCDEAYRPLLLDNRHILEPTFILCDESGVPLAEPAEVQNEPNEEVAP